MAPTKVVVVIGTRPEAVKMAPLVLELRRRPDVEVCVCATGQHREMVDQVLQLFAIAPDVDLSVMAPRQTPNEVLARVVERFDRALADLRPDWVLVQGDTTTVLGASLAAANRRLRIGHVEAGLRSFDRTQPFPEEINRVLADQLADALFAPTALARTHLLREGIADAAVHVTGNTVVDALQHVREKLRGGRALPPDRPAGPPQSGRRLIFVTAHRRENHGAPLQGICHALRLLAESGRFDVVYPVHPNPDVREPVQAALAGVPGVTLTNPLDYLSTVDLLSRSWLALTDSGGIQEEAPAFGVPVLVMREVTERQELIEAGAGQLVGTDPDVILAAVHRLENDEASHRRMAAVANPFGDGHAATRIADVVTTGRCSPFLSLPARSR